MSEKLEEKYKYMCNMVEQMASSINEWQEYIEKVDKEKHELEEISHDQSREIFEYKKIISGAQKKEELLLDYIDNICGIIEAQCPLKEQDLWLADMKRVGLYPDNTYEDEE